MFIIQDWLQNWLRRQPEYGMGYQRATVTLSNGQKENGVILNARVFAKNEDVGWKTLTYDWATMLDQAKRASISVADANLIPRPLDSLKGVRRLTLPNAVPLTARGYFEMVEAKAGPAIETPITYSAADELFKRFSAFMDDFRVTPGKGLTPGTFGTSAEDAANVKTGTEAVSRYALENKNPASYRFTITPPAATKVRRGTVAAAHGEIGGGAEVIFVDGSSDGTVTGPDKLPDK